MGILIQYTRSHVLSTEGGLQGLEVWFGVKGFSCGASWVSGSRGSRILGAVF